MGENTKEWNRQYNFIPYLLLFILSFLFLFWLQNSQTFADPDSFYHAKMIWLMKNKIANGELPIFNEFPWLYYTVLKNNYIDHHFLYHLLSIPSLFFVQLAFKFSLFNQFAISENYKILIAFKLATIFWAALFIVVFYSVLKKIKIKGAVFYSLLLLVINPFIFRLSLGKATATSLIFLFLAIGCFVPQYCGTKPLSRWFYIFLLSFFYVWLYGGWPLMLVIAAVWIISEIISNKTNFQFSIFNFQTNSKLKIKNYLKIIKLKIKNFFINNKEYVKLLITVIGGIVGGLTINPYFPKNLIFYYHQIYEIAIINYKNILNVGSEWYSYNFFELLSASSPAFLLAIPAVVFFVGNLVYYFRKRNNVETRHCLVSTNNISLLLFSFILTIIFLILTLRSRRNVEYLFPFLTLFVASSFNLAIKNFYQPSSWTKFHNILQHHWLLTGVIAGFFTVALPYIIWRDTMANKTQLNGNYSWNAWQNASEWLKQNAKPGEIIFHNDWDDWPFLFFHNDKNYYIVGLDPTFMYKYDANLYQKWSDATLGKNNEPLSRLLTEKFNSKYILVDNEHSSLERNIIDDGKFEKVFEDEKTRIYKISNF